jgi:hypothetical protein
MTAVDQFKADPLTFLQGNLLLVPFTDIAKDRMDDAPIDMVFYSLPQKDAIASKLGTALGLYFLTRKGAVYNNQAVVDGEIKAYFCPFEANNTLGTFVGTNANYFFTTAMDGCTFGIGSAGADGSRMVYHSNLAKFGEGGQATAQADTLKFVFGTSLEKLYEPQDYRKEYGVDSLLSTTFGIRANAAWNFYSQTYTTSPSTGVKKYFLREVKKVL